MASLTSVCEQLTSYEIKIVATLFPWYLVLNVYPIIIAEKLVCLTVFRKATSRFLFTFAA